LGLITGPIPSGFDGFQHYNSSSSSLPGEKPMAFQISALNVDQFSHLFGKDSDTLAKIGVERVIADTIPGYPCRVSLLDAEVGEPVLLMNYEHQSASSPYRSSHAIFVREWAYEARLNEREIPKLLRQRLLSVRAFDDSGMMLNADIVDGQHLEELFQRMLANDAVEYLHLHNAQRGCYVARVDRVNTGRTEVN
jgi:hypothetical protein